VPSDLYVGTTDRQPYILINAPVFRDGRIDHALNIAVRATHLSTLLARTRLPPDWTGSIIDRQDRVVARSRDHERFVGQTATEPVRLNAQGEEGSFRGTTLDGTSVWAAYVRLPHWGWRAAVGVPEAVVRAPLRQSALYLGAGGVLAVALSVLMALVYGRRLARSIGALSGMAGDVGRTAGLAPVMTPVREVNRVAASLAASSTSLQRSLAERDLAQAELQRLNEGLEARIQAEVAARQEAQATALHAQRMQALGQLAGGVAHDFNNVLQAARGCAATIEKRADDPATVRRFARLFLDASERGVSVTRRLLAFAQQNDLRAEAIDLPTLFSGLQEMLSHTLGTHISVHVALPPHIPPALADKGQLETVLVNLATNARDAMPGGGSLTFSASVEAVAADRAEPGGPDPGTYVRLLVSDTGSGMDGAVLARATEPFFTTKGRGQGNGLGLAMARGFAEQSGGRLQIESEAARGTTVSIWLPLAAHAAAAPTRAMPTPAMPPATLDRSMLRPRVLLVEDEDIVREVLVTQLEGEGYEVLPAPHAQAALDLLAQVGRVDALVTDLNMPGMNGLDLIRTVRGQGMSMAAVLLTGNAENGTPLALEGALTQNFSLLRKPVLGSDLTDRIVAMTQAT
jgi:signal transduction histidine kinase